MRPPEFPADDELHDDLDHHTPAEIERLTRLARARATALTAA